MSPALAGGFFTTGATWEALRRLQNHRKVGHFKNIILKRQIYLSFLILIWVLLKLQGSWLSACTSVTAEVPRRVDTAVEAGVRGQGSDQGRTAGEMSVQLMHDGRASRKCSELAFCSLKFQKPGTVLLVGALQP